MSNRDDPNEHARIYAIRFTERAQRDLDAAMVRFAETASEEVAIAWREGVYEALASLAEFPRRYPSAPERFRREVRQILYRRTGSQTAHRILFSISGEEASSPDAPTVVILHVRHASARRMTRKQIREIEAEQ